MLHIHRAERAGALTEALAELLARPLADPFAPEIVAVPTHGMERWLTQRLSHQLGASSRRTDGVCANVTFPSPARVVAEAIAAASGTDLAADPWLPQRSMWPLLETVDACIADQQPWSRALVRHLGGDAGAPHADRSRRLSTVRHLAGLFRRYELDRPSMVLGWSDGRDHDASGQPLGPTRAWQAELWRRLRARIGQPSLAERLRPACARLRDEPSLVTLPERISCFGLTRLPRVQLEVLRALAAGRDVHLFLLHPSPASWDWISAAVAKRGPVVRRDDATNLAPGGNPLLASWGRDARELQLAISASGTAVELHHPTAIAAATLLGRLQADLLADRVPDALAPLDAGDRSLQIHACHGRARQVEVLHDAILHALADDPTLEPRDIVVLCPDIETFAPLIQATFAAGEQLEGADPEGLLDGVEPVETPARTDLHIRLADRSLRQTNPLLGTVSRLLELADERLTASQVLDLVDREPVRRRFGFDDEDITRLEEWAASAGMHWGLDADHRAAYDLAHVGQGTWHAGLDRLALGAAMAEEGGHLFGAVLPLDDVGSGTIELAGRFAELIDRLTVALDAFARPQALGGWIAAITAATDTLTTTTTRDVWQRSELQRLLADLATDAEVGDTACGAVLHLADVRSLVADRLAGRPTRANFRTGHLTACTLVPMRSVPHRVVCVLGLDDTVFPRHAPRDGDDLLLDDPHVGDRDARSEDRQILLDALLAATDRLILTYTGRDERTNALRPPAVPVTELLDVIGRTVRIEDTSATVLLHHPLQPFDTNNFIPGKLVAGTPWSFDPTALAGARALAAERRPIPPFLAEPLDIELQPVIDLDDLVDFVGHPVRAFFRQRLGVAGTARAAELDDALPLELDALTRWAVGERLLAARLAGIETADAISAERARGTLPPGHIGDRAVADLMPHVEAILAAARQADLGGPPSSVDARVTLPDGRVLNGTVAGVVGDVLQTVTFARVGAPHRLAAWVRLLALTATRSDRPFAAVTVGRARRGASRQNARATMARIPLLGGTAGTAEQRRAFATERLTDLTALYDQGMREPLPVYAETSAAYASGDRTAITRATEQWEGSWTRDSRRLPGENEREEHVRVLGAGSSFEELLASTPRADEAGEAWDETETSRFGRYAQRWWGHLPARERVTDR
jgi:exodeoxyribonuclease V gamma subunit